MLPSVTAITSIICMTATCIIPVMVTSTRHVIEVSKTNPDRCTPENGHKGHEAGHVHGPVCGHEAVPHGDHIDYLVDGRLHHPHGSHCDDHGPLKVVTH